jgi:serine/threonine protein kinase
MAEPSDEDRGPRRHHVALPAGYRLHWYEIESILGQGGFGITYLARDTNLDHLVAVKEFLPTDLAVRTHDSSVQPLSEGHTDTYGWGLARFITEAQTLAKFRHTNIVQVHSVFESNNTAYMVMDYVEGQSLRDAFKSPEICHEGRLREILSRIMDGVEQIHEVGFIHRDIKPDNIYLRPNEMPVLLDFGSARQTLGVKTRALTAIVSPGYAPYEQYDTSSETDKQGPWTDIYSLGATIYRAITGKGPIDAMARVTAILEGHDVFQPASELGRDRYSGQFLDAVDCALAFRPQDRPQSIREWRGLLGDSRFGGKAGVRTRARRDPEAYSDADTVINVDEAGESQSGDEGATTQPGPESTLVVPPRLPGAAPAATGDYTRTLREEQQAPGMTEPSAPGAVEPQPPSAKRTTWRGWLVGGAVLGVVAVVVVAVLILDLVPPDFGDRPSTDATVSIGPGSVRAPRDFVQPQIDQLREIAAGYRRVLELDPANGRARQGLVALSDRFADLARFAQAHFGNEMALELVNEGLELRSDSDKLRALQITLQKGVGRGTLNAEDREEIERLTRMAGKYLRELRFVEPPGENAVTMLKAIQSLDPDNEFARKQLGSLGDFFEQSARSRISDGDIQRGVANIEQGLIVSPAHPGLLALREELEARKAVP